MLEVLKILFAGGLIFYAICYIVNVIGKCMIALIVAFNKDLTDQKVEFLAKMMSKDININLHQ